MSIHILLSIYIFNATLSNTTYPDPDIWISK